MNEPFRARRPVILAGAVLLVLATSFVYARVRHHEFVTYDDALYITENVEVQKGLTLESARWALTSTHTGNWHPVTWLSHMLDIELWGNRPGPHHLENVGLHLANVLMLYLLLIVMTGAFAPSLFVAAAFALHPLHVESVAWAAERKDLLSTFFGLLAMGAWVGWTRRGGSGLYAAALAAYALSLASKPMLVTLPVLLLLLDVWPLQRMGSGRRDEVEGFVSSGAGDVGRAGARAREALWRIRPFLIEKAPFAALAAASAMVAILAQAGEGATATLEAVGLGSRIQNAIVAYASYVVDTLFPVDLGVLYPLRERTPAWMIEGAAFFLVTVTILVLAGARRKPWLAVGWLWYLVALLPVIGLIQVGVQSRADRYTYIPLVGLFLMAAWGFRGAFASRGRAAQAALAVAASVCVLCWAVRAHSQLRTWRDSVTLYTHALEVDNQNPVIHYNLADSLAERGQREAAIAHYRAALAYEPDFLEARNNLGNTLRSLGRLDEAIDAYRAAISYEPGYALGHNNLGLALAEAGRYEEAVTHYLEALRLDPTYTYARRNLGRAQYVLGRLDDAADRFREVLVLDPGDADAHYRLGNVYAEQGRREDAIAEYERSIATRPGAAAVHVRLASLLAAMGRTAEASAHYCEGLHLDPQAELLAGAGALPGSRAALSASLASFRGGCPSGPGTRRSRWLREGRSS